MGATKEQKLQHYHRKQAEKSELKNTFPQIDTKPKRPRIKKACADSLEMFCLRYLPERFEKDFSPTHQAAIRRLEGAILHGEQFALAMPRGSGKTTLCISAVIWAAVYGHCRYAVLISATERSATNLLRSIKDTFRFSERLRDDFPRLVWPLIALGNEPRATNSQTYDAVPTTITWSADRIVLPYMPGEPGSECVIDCAGITGEIRGRTYTRRDGSIVRPEVGIVDDPQTRKSARATNDVIERLATIKGDVMFLAGPGKSNGCVVPCTVIRKGDVADQLLDREANPEFHGLRVAFFEKMPNESAMQLWEGEYNRLRRQAMMDDRPPDEANAYYRQNQAAMDAGSDVYWDARYNPDKGEISAVQHGMNLYLADRASFLAEFQNSPEASNDVPPIAMLSEDETQRKVNGLSRRICPAGTAHIVSMVDVHPSLLYYSTVAVKSDFTGSIIDYGTWPDQRTRDFSHVRPRHTLDELYPGSVEQAITKGLTDLANHLCRGYTTLDGRTLTMGKLLIDTGFQPDAVYAAIQRSDHKAVMLGSRGVGLSPESKPFSEYDLSPQRVLQYGPRDNCRWYVPNGGHGSGVVRFDKYFWLSSLHARFVTPVPEPSAWELYGDRYTDHRMVASHLRGQLPVEVHARGRSIIQWKADRSREDHWLDTLVGCMVAASMLGCELPGRPVPEAPPEKITLKQWFGGKK